MKRVNFTLCLAQVKQKQGRNVMKFMLLHKSEHKVYCTYVRINVCVQQSMVSAFVWLRTKVRHTVSSQKLSFTFSHTKDKKKIISCQVDLYSDTLSV